MTELPWDSISPVSGRIAKRRVDDIHPHEFSWGRSSSGLVMLILELSSDVKIKVSPDDCNLSGITSEFIRHQAPERVALNLTLNSGNRQDQEIFMTLCMDIVERTREKVNRDDILSDIFKRLDKWRRIFRKGREKILSEKRIQGLFGELVFLEKITQDKQTDISHAVDSWRGPLGAPQDFVVGDRAYEIKTLLGASPGRTVDISNENQLYWPSGELFLVVVQMRKHAGGKEGISLNGIVKRISANIHGKSFDRFEELLAEYGYMELPVYDSPAFSVDEFITYPVNDGFPKITPEMLNIGISCVSYSVSLEKIRNYASERPDGGNNDC